MVCAGYVDGGMDMDRDADDLHGWRGSCGGPARRRRGTIAYLIRGYTSHSDVVLDLDGTRRSPRVPATCTASPCSAMPQI